MTEIALVVVCVVVVLYHTFFVWPPDDRPLAKIYYMDDYRDRHRLR